MNKQDFFALLGAFDWTYEYSDDHNVWKKGSKHESEIKEVLKQQPELQEMYDAFYSYIWVDRNNKPKLEDFV